MRNSRHVAGLQHLKGAKAKTKISFLLRELSPKFHKVAGKYLFLLIKESCSPEKFVVPLIQFDFLPVKLDVCLVLDAVSQKKISSRISRTKMHFKINPTEMASLASWESY